MYLMVTEAEIHRLRMQWIADWCKCILMPWMLVSGSMETPGR